MVRVAILHDPFVQNPTLDEKDSLETARLISGTLTSEKCEVISVPFSANWTETLLALRQAQPQVVINLVEELDGDPRLNYLGGVLLEHSQLPYTGSRAETLYITTQKLITKKLLGFDHLPTPDWCSSDNLESFAPHAPYVVKPVNLDASVGIQEDAFQIFEQAEQLRRHLQQKKAASGIEFFAERYIAGREFWIPMLGYAEEP
ncbi:MAG TPA: hypothetical protein VFF78_01170, partial [Anaerolineaceae bacterium]|nr:hypothetical protein [Anaerolineaceae bacterium]